MSSVRAISPHDQSMRAARPLVGGRLQWVSENFQFRCDQTRDT